MSERTGRVLQELDSLIEAAPAAERSSLVIQLAARLATLGAGLTGSPESAPAFSDGDCNLDVSEAARLLGMSKQWVYRNARRLPFARRIGRRLVFSRPGLVKWSARQ